MFVLTFDYLVFVYLRDRPATAICVLSLLSAKAFACPSWQIRSATVPSGIANPFCFTKPQKYHVNNSFK